MKVSLNTVKQFTDVDLSVDELVAKIGAQLGAVEAVYNSGAKYDGVIVAKVVKCEKHPNADKLSICQIDTGDGTVQVVCGAPNVREGLTVAWIPPGATVPSTYWGDKFVLEAREIRGEVSNGMLASPSELAISDNHDGILEIEEDVAPGTPFKQLYGLDDVTIEIENKMFTHRPDCFGVLGVAREIAGIQQKQFISPDWYKKPITPQNLHLRGTSLQIQSLQIQVVNEVPDLVPRFMVVAMSNVEIKPSPVWLQALLTRVAIKPINNVVDITNYLSYITAQPLHAYDYDKVKALSKDTPTLTARLPKKGEKIPLLNGKTIEPRDEAIMIATDKELTGVAGVMGGTNTEVDNNTKNIIIECANFDMYSIRRTSMTHGLFTEAVTRFNKGQSALQNDRVIVKAMQMMSELAGAEQASEVIDNAPKLPKLKTVEVSADFINTRLGLDLTNEQIAKILQNVEMETEDLIGKVRVTAPFWRTDIEIPEDIVEEVGRLLGFDQLPLELPKRTVTPTPVDETLKRKSLIRSKLASFGANEILTYSFAHGKLLEKAGQDSNIAFKLTNALSPDLQYYRLSLTPSLLSHVHQNIKAGHDQFALFEIGKTHTKTEIDEEGVPREFSRVALVLADKNSKQAAYYQARVFMEQLTTSELRLVPYDLALTKGHKMMNQMFIPYDPARSAMLVNAKNIPMGVVGEFTPAVAKAFKLPAHCAGFELFLSVANPSDKSYTPLSRYPSISQDICLEVASSMSYGELEVAVNELLTKAQAGDQAITVKPIDIYSSEEQKDKKRITFRVILTDYERTLTDEVLSRKLDDIAAELAKTHSAYQI